MLPGTQHLKKESNSCQLHSINTCSLEWNQYALSIYINMHKEKGSCFQEPALALGCSWLKVIEDPAWESPSQLVVARVSPHACNIQSNRETKLVVWSEGKGTLQSCLFFPPLWAKKLNTRGSSDFAQNPVFIFILNIWVLKENKWTYFKEHQHFLVGD